MARDDERRRRATDEPVVGGLPDLPGILAAASLTPGLAASLGALADNLLVEDFPGASLTRGERELLATAVSAANDCFFCMDAHGAFACELLSRAGATAPSTLVTELKSGGSAGLGPKMAALVHIARTVQRRALDVTRADVVRALDAGATDADTQLAVLIASAFCMYNRLVDGLRASTPASLAMHEAVAAEIADHGYAVLRNTPAPR